MEGVAGISLPIVGIGQPHMAPDAHSGDAPCFPVVHVLISEDFFQERVAGVLRALRKAPTTPAWEGDVFERIAAQPALGAVVDLELGEIEVLNLLRRMRSDPRTRDRILVCYCSLEARAAQASAIELGLPVVPRSTLAANLVKILQAFGPPEPIKD